jgi:plastocyanin
MRQTAVLLAVAVAGLALAAGATSSPNKAPTKLVGTVGPGFTITLKKAGRKVTRLPAGRYSITVNDRSSSHNFRLRGGGMNRQITTVGMTGKRTITVTLKKGKRYTYVCDPHASSMRGSVRVT